MIVSMNEAPVKRGFAVTCPPRPFALVGKLPINGMRTVTLERERLCE